MTMTSTDLPIRCSCGTLRGIVRGASRRNGKRAICHCDDCQKYAHFLQRADEILDAHGGTEILQTSPARLQLASGVERLACVRLTPKGILRWYADCCHTPIGNTPATRTLPYLGLVHSCLDPTEARPMLDSLLGPVQLRVFACHARGDRAVPDAHDGLPVTAILPVMGRVLIWRLRGDHRRSPFFDAQDAQPKATPHVLTTDELQKVESEQSNWPGRQPVDSRE